MGSPDDQHAQKKRKRNRNKKSTPDSNVAPYGECALLLYAIMLCETEFAPPVASALAAEHPARPTAGLQKKQKEKV